MFTAGAAVRRSRRKNPSTPKGGPCRAGLKVLKCSEEGKSLPLGAEDHEGLGETAEEQKGKSGLKQWGRGK